MNFVQNIEKNVHQKKEKPFFFSKIHKKNRPKTVKKITLKKIIFKQNYIKKFPGEKKFE